MRYILIYCLLLFSCQVDKSSVESLPEKFFFDVPSFFKQEIKNLQQAKIIGLHKEININDKLEIQKPSIFDLEKELAIFRNADINKLAWKDQYQVDSVLVQQQLAAIHYTALKDNLKTKKLSVYIEEGEISHLQIRKGLANMAAQSTQELTYYKGKGYTITNQQTLVLSEPQHIEMEVKYVFE